LEQGRRISREDLIEDEDDVDEKEIALALRGMVLELKK
jgi:hypothetical protein